MSKLKEKAGQLARYLQSRQLPMEGEELKYKTQQIHNKVTANGEYTQCRCVTQTQIHVSYTHMLMRTTHAVRCVNTHTHTPHIHTHHTHTYMRHI